MTRRGYSDATVDEHIERDQLARAAREHARRMADPRWTLRESTDSIPGLVWVREDGKGED